MARLYSSATIVAGLTLLTSMSWPDSAKAQQTAEPAPKNGLQQLYDKGVLVRATLNNDFQSNVGGGLERGSENAGTATLGADFNFDKLLGVRGGQLHVLVAKSYGDTLQSKIGNYIKTQGWYYPYQTTQLAQFAWEQVLADGKVNIYAGRTNATAAFARPTYGCKFISGSQCPYYLPLFTGGFSGFPYVTWGGRIKFNPTPKLYAQAGIYQVDPDRRLNHGINLSTHENTGNVIPVEAGYETNFNNDKYPRHYKVGWWRNDAPQIDPQLNARGQSRALVPGPPLTHDGNHTGVYALFDQVVYRPDESKRNVAVFASYAAPHDNDQVFDSQSTLGMVFSGPFANRPNDSVGLMETHAVFSQKQTHYMNQLLAKNGSSSFVDSHSDMIEANYGYQLWRGVTLSPNVEYIIHPDTSQRPDATFAPSDTWVVGLRLSLNLGDMFGLPSELPGHN